LIFRRLLVAVLALLLAAQVVRTAAVDAFGNVLPAQAARFWPGHPTVQESRGLIEIAEAARGGRQVSAETLARIYAASRKAPLSPDPFLVRGVQAQMNRDLGLAERAFQAARLRDPRSLPARYFLADLYLRNGDARRGLPEIAVLARLVPQGASKVAPYVASYAQNRANWPILRDLFRDEPALEDASLMALAEDPKNADTVLALAHPERRNAATPWLSILVDRLTKAGDFRRARQIWSDVSGARLAPGALVFDPGFTQADAPPPFNWALTSSTVGLAERQQGRGLHVMFYGQQDGVLASQLLVLPPGRYRLSTNAPNAPEGASALRWTLVCARDSSTLASVPLDQAMARGWQFQVPPSCAAQRLELFGTSSDVARQTDLTIRSIELTREPAGA
jgi:hypothetical protein